MNKLDTFRNASTSMEEMARIKTRVHSKLLASLDLLEAQRAPTDQLRMECMRRVDNLLTEERCPLSLPEKQQLLNDVMDDIFGLGPLEEFLRDPSVCDILVNGPAHIYIERGGQLERTGAFFTNTNHLMQVISRIASRVGRRIDDSSPMLDARLSDGSRVNAIIPPLSLDGPTLSIRRFGTMPLDRHRLVELETAAPDMVMFLEACVKAKRNILISGGTGSGKTTLLNLLSQYIPPAERVVTIEDAAELQLQREHVVRLETRPRNIEGKGEVTQRDLLRNTLRMRPDRIIIGEVRGDEALDMLQAMNTGHEGSMTTIHSNSSRDALSRLENMVSMSGLNYPVHAIRQQMSSAINILVHLSRITGGQRKILAIAEITGMEGDKICMSDIFAYHQTGVDADGRAQGCFVACGVYPKTLDKFKAEGMSMPPQMFQRRTLSFSEKGG